MRHTLYIIVLLLGLLLGGTACAPTPHDAIPADEPLVIYPDYQNVTVPCNIAPLNFMIRGDFDAIACTIRNSANQEELILAGKGKKIILDGFEWKELTRRHLGDSLLISVTARRERDGQWIQYPDFAWHISRDSIDSFITYRLIEPGYEVWDNVSIEERCIETFDKRYLADGPKLSNRCMNCHTHGGDRGQYSFFYIRGEGGGTILNRDGMLRKVTLKSPKMNGGSVYGDWHPSGRYAVYSTNVIIPSFHSKAHKRFEVYDTQSDLCVADFDRDTILMCPLVTNTPNILETFPAFSADGRWIYFCTAENPCGDTIPSAVALRDKVDELHYSLCRLSFDAVTGTFGTKVDTIYNARLEKGSVNFPKCSPDGRYLCFTISDFGTFPIWHQEARLCFLDLANDSVNTITITPENGTYHTWSHNSKWIAFASKRADGQYGRVYFSHIEDNTDLKTLNSTTNVTLSKPLVLPQSDPEMDDWNLRSYNIPDLSTLSVPFGEEDVKLLFERVPSTPFK